MTRLILLSLVLLMSSFAYSQSFELRDYNNNLITNDQQVDIWGDASSIELDYGLHSENATNNTVTVGLRRYEVDVTSGSQNYFCWNVCYSPTDAGVRQTWVAQDALIMETDSVYTNFHAYHRPTGTTGLSVYRYVFYNKTDLNDTISVTITFNASPNSVNELTAAEKLTIYPNPVANMAHITYKLENNDEAKLELHNMLGSKVKEIKLDATQNKLDLSVRDLNPGVYFYTLVQDNKAIATKRLVVSGK